MLYQVNSKCFACCLVIFLVLTSPAYAVYTQARIIGPYRFTACSEPQNSNPQMGSIGIRVDREFGTENLYTIFMHATLTEVQREVCEIDPMSADCLASFPDEQRFVLPNYRQADFVRHSWLADSTIDVLAVVLRFHSGEIELAHSRVEQIEFIGCSTTPLPTLQSGAGFNSPASDSFVVPGTSPDYVNHHAVAHWGGEPMFQIMTEDTTVGVVAKHPTGIQEVRLQANGGPVLVLTDETIHPESAHSGFWADFNPSQLAPGSQVEFRAEIIPNQGRTLVLAGAITPENSLSGIWSHIAYTSPANSHVAVTVAENGNDITGDGSLANPFATAARAVDHIKQQNGGILSNSSIYYLEGTYFYGTGNPDWSSWTLFPHGPITVSAHPSIADISKVKFIGMAPEALYSPANALVERVSFTPEVDGGGLFDYRYPFVPAVTVRDVDYLGPVDSSRHGPVVERTFLYSSAERVYTVYGLRGHDGQNRVKDVYQYWGAGIFLNDIPYFEGAFVENIDQSRVDLPGMQWWELNHGDVSHIYGLNRNIFHRRLSGLDILTQGHFVSAPKDGLYLEDIDLDMTRTEKVVGSIHAAGFPWVANQSGAYVVNVNIVGGSSIVGGLAAAPGTKFVIQNSNFEHYWCNGPVSEDCSQNSTGALYLNAQ